MAGRSQRHLEEVQGTNSAGEASGVSITITAPVAGAVTNPVSFDPDATNAYGQDVSKNVRWSSDVDGYLGAGAFTTTLTAGAHVITASHSGVEETAAITVS